MEMLDDTIFLNFLHIHILSYDYVTDMVIYDLGLFEDIEDAVVARNKFKLSRGEIIYE